MIFTKHSEIKGQHALFSASQNSWLRYDDDQIEQRVRNQYRTTLGTEIHEYCASQIELEHKVTSIRSLVAEIENHLYVKYKCMEDGKLRDYGMTLIRKVRDLPKEVFETAKAYINDGIGYRMTVEQPLVYSEFFFGTADAISFRDNILRIHDFKSGDAPAKIDQLLVYAAFFCLEYVIKPRDIKVELRLYQAGECVTYNPEPDEIQEIMDKIIDSNCLVEKIKAREE